jgi:hypothetical protein
MSIPLWAALARPALLALPVLTVLMVVRDLPALPVLRGHPAAQVPPAQLELVLPVLPAPRDLRVPRALMV